MSLTRHRVRAPATLGLLGSRQDAKTWSPAPEGWRSLRLVLAGALLGCAGRLSEPDEYADELATACQNDVDFFRDQVESRKVVHVRDARGFYVKVGGREQSAQAVAAGHWIRSGAWDCIATIDPPPTDRVLAEHPQDRSPGSPFPWWTAAAYAVGREVLLAELRAQEVVDLPRPGPARRALIDLTNEEWEVLVAGDDGWFREAMLACLRETVPLGTTFNDDSRDRGPKRQELNECLGRAERPGPFAKAVAARRMAADSKAKASAAAQAKAEQAQGEAEARLAEAEIQDGKCLQERFDLLQQDLDTMSAQLRKLSGSPGYLRDHSVHVLDGSTRTLSLRSFSAHRTWVILRGFGSVDLAVRDEAGHEYTTAVGFQQDDGLHLGVGPALGADSVALNAAPGEIVEVGMTGRGCVMLSVFNIVR